MTKQLVIGIGPGRSGSMSLAHFLNRQPGVEFTHEGVEISQFPVEGKYGPAIKSLMSRPSPIVGDINPNWLLYIERLVDEIPDVKIIMLCRTNLYELTESFYQIKSANPAFHKETENYALAYPVNAQFFTKQAIVDSLNRYLRCCDLVRTKYRLNIFELFTEDLDSKRIQRHLIHWLGIPAKKQKLGMERLNVREEALWKNMNGRTLDHVSSK